MDVMDGITLGLVVLCSIAMGVMLYFKVRGNVFAVVSELIALAEATGLTGVEKMDQVVLGLYELVPKAFRGILTLSKLESIAQHIFDWMRKYADEYRTQLEEKKQEQSEQDVAESVGIEATAALIADLLALTRESLKLKAQEYGVDSFELNTKHDYIEAIVKAMLKQ